MGLDNYIKFTKKGCQALFLNGGLCLDWGFWEIMENCLVF